MMFLLYYCNFLALVFLGIKVVPSQYNNYPKHPQYEFDIPGRIEACSISTYFLLITLPPLSFNWLNSSLILSSLNFSRNSAAIFLSTDILVFLWWWTTRCGTPSFCMIAKGCCSSSPGFSCAGFIFFNSWF